MARVNIEGVIDHLSSDIRRALAMAVLETVPDAEADAHALYRAFRRAVRRKCNSWESVPDDLVEALIRAKANDAGRPERASRWRV